MHKVESFGVSRAVLEPAFGPAVERQCEPDDVEWRRLEDEYRSMVRRAATRSRLAPLAKLLRPSASLNYKYEQKWSPEFVLSRLSMSEDRSTPVTWGEDRYLAHGWGVKRAHLLYLMEIIEACRPERVLEVGSGGGHNLLILAARFPDIAFEGIELSAAGVATAQGFAARDALPDEMVRFSPKPIVDPTGHRRVRFSQASATELPFPDRAFDLVFSIQALEQMEPVRDAALSEVARAAADRVVMFEPFRDFNADGMRRKRVRGSRYFSAWVRDLPRYGLEPVFFTDDLPQKLYYSIGLVVARRMSNGGSS